MQEARGASVVQEGVSKAERLNRGCFCITLDRDALMVALNREAGSLDFAQALAVSHASLFSNVQAFVPAETMVEMTRVVSAAEAAARLPSYGEAVLSWAPPIAGLDLGPIGVFMGYDFHVTPSGPKLIEINTNAGGALLNAALARAQRACCPAIAGMTTGSVALNALDQTFVSMFFAEWRLARGDRVLRRIAIVDETPTEQYLYPEFILFKQLFRRHGVEAVIVDPSALRLRDNVLWHGDDPVDLVYNRLTDFMLGEPANAVLRDAYLNNDIVLTPHPRVHALYANKRNLAVLSDPVRLQSFGVSEGIVRTLLSGIPKTEIVEASNAERLWSERRKLFFKPASGFGSKAAYRGDKLTKRVWEHILAGDYIAQALVPPGERLIKDHLAPIALKFDVRNYVYDGAVQFITARLYQGQTTNLRTPGGGFSPVFTDISTGSKLVVAHCEGSGTTT